MCLRHISKNFKVPQNFLCMYGCHQQTLLILFMTLCSSHAYVIDKDDLSSVTTPPTLNRLFSLSFHTILFIYLLSFLTELQSLHLFILRELQRQQRTHIMQHLFFLLDLFLNTYLVITLILLAFSPLILVTFTHRFSNSTVILS